VVVPVHAAVKTLREALWFEVNPPLKNSAQKSVCLCALCLPRRCGASYWGERLKTLLGSKPSLDAPPKRVGHRFSENGINRLGVVLT